MVSPKDDPLNKPVLDAVADSSEYVQILTGTLRHVHYLCGEFPERMRPVFQRGIWIPAISKIQYGLLCVALKSPEHENQYHSFCSAVNEKGRSLTIATIPDATSLSAVKDLFENEIERYSKPDV
jgi:hypothetical protein